jgi:exodeoxyribonuclease VII small subunit
MADQKPGAFEQKVAELESIVKQLERGDVELDKAVELFNRGKALADECEKLLKSAQEQIDRAMEQPAAQAPPDSDEIPF